MITAPAAAKHPATSKRRGAILLAVMLIITIAALVGTSVLYTADAQRGSATITLQQAQLRSLAWSGVQGAMAQLAAQREALLRGEQPTLTAEWSLFEGSTTGDIRLAPLDPQSESSTAASECAKLDLNTATAPMLAKLPGLNDELAGKVLAARGKEFGAPEELARVQGLPASILLDVPSDSISIETAAPRGLLALTTTFAFDPNTAADGQPKVNISGGWSEEIKTDLTARFPEVAKTLEPLLATAGKVAGDPQLIAILRRNKIPPEQWDALLAAVTTSDEQFNRGRVDLNLAPVEVLAAIPGLDRPAAEKIIDARARVSLADREKVTWPLTQGAVTPDQFEKASAWLTTHSLQWRVRVEARLRSGPTQESKLGSTLKIESETLDPPGMVWEAVIDVSDTRPRVAYLRDVTHLPGLARQALANEQSQDSALAAAPDSERAGNEGTVSDVPPEPSLEGRKSKAGSGIGSMKRQEFKMDSGLNFGSSKGGAGRSADHASPPAENHETEKAGGTPPPASKDRRIGRWRGGSKE